MDFTFGIVTYNSGRFVIEALESIRYQVERYGKGHRITLIVSDDCSTDDTVELASDWIEQFGHMFERTQIMTVEKNTGVAHNYTRILRNITDEYFNVIAGDDLISSWNVFEQFGHVGTECMNLYMTVEIIDGKVCIRDESCTDMYYFKDRKHTNKKDIHSFEMGKPFTSPEAKIGRQYFTEECLNVIQQYVQFEDDPSQYYILKNNPGMTFKFIPEPSLLYRRHAQSLTRSTMNTHQIQFLDDMHKFKKHMLKTEKHIGMKFIIFLDVCVSFRMKHRFGIRKTMFGRLQKLIMGRRARIVHGDAGYAKFKKLMESYALREQEHVEYVRQKADEFLSSDAG